MNIKDIPVLEIKALLYDLASDQERISHNMKVLKDELQRRSEEVVESQEEDSEKDD